MRQQPAGVLKEYRDEPIGALSAFVTNCTTADPGEGVPASQLRVPTADVVLHEVRPVILMPESLRRELVEAQEQPHARTFRELTTHRARRSTGPGTDPRLGYGFRSSS